MESINVHLEIREFAAFKFVWLRRFPWIERMILATVLTIEISIFHEMGCILLLSYVQTDAATPNNFGTCSASLKDTTHKTLENMVNARTWPQNCWKSWANQIQHYYATLRRAQNKRNVGSCWLKSLTGFKLCAEIRKNMQQGVQTDATCDI